MRHIRSLLVLVAALALVLAASSAQAAEKGKAKHHGHAVRGVVTMVSPDGKSVTIKVTQHHKKGAAATAAPTEATEKTFAIKGETKYFFVSGRKGKAKKGEAKAVVKKGENMKPATLADVKPGEHVVVVAIKGDAKIAKVILIREKKAKKPVA